MIKSLNGRALSLCCHRNDDVHPHTEEPWSLEEETLLCMPEENRRKKKKAIKKRSPKYKKEEIKNQKNKKKSIRLKNQDPHQARHTSSWRSSSTWWFRSVSCYFGLRPPMCKEEDANALYWRGICASMTYLKSSQATNKPKNHKNKIKRKPKPPK